MIDSSINLAQPVNWSSQLTQGLKSWWLAIPAWRGGLTWYDLCRNNDVALTSMDPPTDWVASTRRGGFGWLDFDGSNDYCTKSATIGLPLSQVITISFWYVSKSTPGATKGILGKASTSAASNWGVQHGTGDTIDFHWNSATPKHVSTGTVPPNTPTHVTCVRSGVSSNWTAAVYFNGLLDSSTASIAGNPSGSDRPLVIGCRDSAPSAFRDCQLDDIRIYDRVLSIAEILALYLDSLNGCLRTLHRTPKFALTVAEAVIVDPADALGMLGFFGVGA